jgi:hypothetical protein
MKLGYIIRSPDFVISAILGIVLYLFIPELVKITFFLSSYMIGITVLSIVFSLFFAALAIVMTSSDDEYIVFLNDLNVFDKLRGMFEFTLGSLFVSLVYAIVVYIISDYIRTQVEGDYLGHKIFFIIFACLFCYSMLATLPSVWHTLKFSQYRVQYLTHQRKITNVEELLPNTEKTSDFQIKGAVAADEFAKETRGTSARG